MYWLASGTPMCSNAGLPSLVPAQVVDNRGTCRHSSYHNLLPYMHVHFEGMC